MLPSPPAEQALRTLPLATHLTPLTLQKGPAAALILVRTGAVICSRRGPRGVLEMMPPSGRSTAVSTHPSPLHPAHRDLHGILVLPVDVPKQAAEAGVGGERKGIRLHVCRGWGQVRAPDGCEVTAWPCSGTVFPSGCSPVDAQALPLHAVCQTKQANAHQWMPRHRPRSTVPAGRARQRCCRVNSSCSRRWHHHVQPAILTHHAPRSRPLR